MKGMICYAPQSIGALCADLQQMTPNSKLLAGGTDLSLQLHQGRLKLDALLYLGDIPELRQISGKQGGLEIGAAVTMAQLAASPLLTGKWQAMKDAASKVGSMQIRSRATIGGNIANASPAGDLLPVLILLKAEAEIVNAQGRYRRIPVEQLVCGAGKTILNFDEALTQFYLPPTKIDCSAFVKLGYRPEVTVARINLCAALRLNENGGVQKANVVTGAVAARPVHLTEAEAYLQGKRIEESTAKALGGILSQWILEHTPEEFDGFYKSCAAYGVAADLLEGLQKS